MWMAEPLEARLLDLRRVENSWPFVGFALLSGCAPADIDLLAAKHAGRTFAKAVAAIYPNELSALRQAAERLRWADPWRDSVLGEALPLAVTFTGRGPTAITIEDLERLRGEVKATPYYTAHVRHASPASFTVSADSSTRRALSTARRRTVAARGRGISLPVSLSSQHQRSAG